MMERPTRTHASKARVAREQGDGAQGAVAILAPGRVAVTCQRADAMKKPVRSTNPCEPAGTMHVRCERYVMRALSRYLERGRARVEPKIHWSRVSSRGVEGAPHVRATKGSDRAGRGEQKWHTQRVALGQLKGRSAKLNMALFKVCKLYLVPLNDATHLPHARVAVLMRCAMPARPRPAHESLRFIERPRRTPQSP